MAIQWKKTFSIKKNVEPEVLEFFAAQSNFSDSILYLVQKEIAENGVRDLQRYIPGTHTIASVSEFLGIDKPISTNKKKYAAATTRINDDFHFYNEIDAYSETISSVEPVNDFNEKIKVYVDEKNSTGADETKEIKGEDIQSNEMDEKVSSSDSSIEAEYAEYFN